ncbi:hypothetical protein QAD02_006715 [Eretmocerus hayati]|uniref:Uncharacterized protein n=1 Tax=Eretmocerus hayati TaxID=131215 RepID=A0ACC2N238_9HYME|nr:hypothetical protein QAD02_006715 [Eretmocerus hayati]
MSNCDDTSTTQEPVVEILDKRTIGASPGLNLENKSSSSKLEVQVIGCTRLLLDGYAYGRHQILEKKTGWYCVRNKREASSRCYARIYTSNVKENDGKVVVYQYPGMSAHNHPPNPEDIGKPRASRRKIKEKGFINSSRAQKPKLSDGPYDFHQTDFVRDPMKYHEFSMKFFENPSFVKGAIDRAVDVLSSNIMTTPVSSSSKETETNTNSLGSTLVSNLSSQVASSSSTTTSQTIDPTTSQIESESDNICPIPIEIENMGNEKTIEVLTTTIEATFITVQQLAELLAFTLVVRLIGTNMGHLQFITNEDALKLKF